MHPIFLSVPIPGFFVALLARLGIQVAGPFEIHTYGVMAALGFFIAIGIVTREAQRQGLNADTVTNLLFGLILWGVIGSRLLFVLLEWRMYLERPFAILNIREGGLVFQGGLIAAVIYAWFFLRRSQLPFWKTADVVVLGIPVGHLFGRLGCVSAGCCYGRPTDAPWAIVFTDPLSAMPMEELGIPRHPVQLYEALGNLLIFAGLLYLLRRWRRFEGQVFLIYFMLYPILRVVVELFRGDVVRGFLLEAHLGQLISTSQFISMLELIAAIALYVWRRNRLRSPPAAEGVDGVPTPG